MPGYDTPFLVRKTVGQIDLALANINVHKRCMRLREDNAARIRGEGETYMLFSEENNKEIVLVVGSRGQADIKEHFIHCFQKCLDGHFEKFVTHCHNVRYCTLSGQQEELIQEMVTAELDPHFKRFKLSLGPSNNDPFNRN